MIHQTSKDTLITEPITILIDDEVLEDAQALMHAIITSLLSTVSEGLDIVIRKWEIASIMEGIQHGTPSDCELFFVTYQAFLNPLFYE